MSDIERWQIATGRWSGPGVVGVHYVGDVVDGPETPEGGLIEVVRADAYQGVVAALEAIRDFDAYQTGTIAPRENPTTAAMRRIAADALGGQ